jgi:DnaJ-class molecular chaperone
MYDDFYREVDIENCQICGGEGLVSGANLEEVICPECHGTGLLIKKKKLNDNKYLSENGNSNK